MSNNQSNSNTHMWEMLTQTITENIDSSVLNKILIMIRKNLTFEDPGLFSSHLLADETERLREEAANTWLVNELIYSITVYSGSRSIKDNIALQKEILSASFVKQPWFFENLTQHYISATKILFETFVESSYPLEIKTFSLTNYPINLIAEKCFYHQVIIENDVKRFELIQCFIEILKHAASLGIDLYSNIFKKSTTLILNIFNIFPIHIKSLCLDYLNKILWVNNDFNLNNINLILIILQANTTILSQLAELVDCKAIEIHVIEQYEENLCSFYQIMSHTYEKFFTFEKIQDIIQTIILSLKYMIDKLIKILPIFQKLIKILIKCLKNFLKNGRIFLDMEQIQTLIKCSFKIPDCFQIFEFYILNKMKETIENNKNKNLVWNLIINMLKTNIKNTDENNVIKSAQILYEILQLAVNINHNFIVWHQIQHREEIVCILCKSVKDNGHISTINEISLSNFEELYINSSEVANIFSTFFTQATKKRRLSFAMYLALKNVAAIALQSTIAPYLNDNFQIQLIQFLCYCFRDRLNLTLNTIDYPIENGFNDLENNFEQSFLFLININQQYLKKNAFDVLKSFMKKIINNIFAIDSQDFQKFLITQYLPLLFNEFITLDDLYKNLIKVSLNDLEIQKKIFENIKQLICLIKGDIFILLTKDESFKKYKIFCKNCNQHIDKNYKSKSDNEIILQLMKNFDGIPVTKNCMLAKNFEKEFFETLFEKLTTKLISVDLINMLATLIKHSHDLQNHDFTLKWIKLFSNTDKTIQLAFSNQVAIIFKILNEQQKDKLETILTKCIRELLYVVNISLNDIDKEQQTIIIELIFNLASVEVIPEEILLQLFKMILMFLMRYESCVSPLAALYATEMCSRHGFTPKNLLNWYKYDIIKLITALCVSIYLKHGTGINKSLNNVTKMLGYIGSKDFISKHYRLLITELLPFCIKVPNVLELMEEIAVSIQRDVPSTLTASFLTAYPNLFLNNTAEINNKCIEYLIENTGNNLLNLLHSDIKRTVAEILIYYHKNPENVTKIFRNLLHNISNTSNKTEITNSQISEYIATRFLGVLTYFESCIVDIDFDKSLKCEALLSLGEIMRFIGSENITPFRFKILATLRTALTVNNKILKSYCANIWNIFVHIVDLQTLGPLLSTIVASLEPLLETNANEVNAILKYLIITNGNLLSLYIPDLYFIENMNISKEIKDYVASQTEKIWKNDNFMEQFEFLLKQTNHENLTVRIYGINYLRKLFKKNRGNLNQLILGQENVKPIIEKFLSNIIISCKHSDKNLQLAAGKCLGELGAIEPSYLPPNYTPQRSFSLNIHTDSFAIMALKELCQAYQFQKDTKYVDSFSLAIQEILVARGVCPKTKKKMEVWQAIPEQMRQLMEPLLTSCYTGLKMKTNLKIHPIFGSSKYTNCEEWAFLWASKLITTNIHDEETQHLLNSFKPSIKRDMNILSLFLPYIILHALEFSNDEEHEKIFEEFQCVFNSVVDKDTTIEFDLIKNRMKGLRTIQFISNIGTNKVEEQTEFIDIKCSKLALEQLDFLERWLREWHEEYAGHSPAKGFNKINSFLNRFNKKTIAKASFNCQEYARALLYLESYIEKDIKNLLQDNLSFLSQIYAELKDPDSLEGAISLKKTELTLTEQILVNNMTDRPQESIACFEHLMQSSQITVSNVNDIIKCYLRLDTPEMALLVSEGLLNQLGEQYTNDSLKEIQAEPLWRLGRYEELEELLSNSDVSKSDSWGVQCGRTLLNLRNNNTVEFQYQIEQTITNILKLLRTDGVEQNSYHKGYPQVMKLHLITEIEKAKQFIDSTNEITSVEDVSKLFEIFLQDLDYRFNLLQQTSRITEPVLCLRRIILNEISESLQKHNKNKLYVKNINRVIEKELGKMWIQSAKFSRKSGMYQQAQLCIMNAEKYNPANLFLEKAKLFWNKGDQTKCFKVIEQKITDMIGPVTDNNSIQNLPKNIRLLFGEAKFLQASYNAESMNISTDANIRYFKESLKGNEKSEKTLVHLAQYLDRVYIAMSESDQQNSNGTSLLILIITYYGSSMSFGCKFIYQSMPKMLTIWLDYTAQMRKNEQFRKTASKMNDIIEKFSDLLPAFIFFTAFSQLISRICHPSTEVYVVLKTIIVRLIQKFPQQSLWMILSVFKSSYTSRVKRCREIFDDRRLAQPNMQKLITDFNSLAEKLIELTNKEISRSEKRTTVSKLCYQLPKILNTPGFSKIIMPIEKFMQPTLPPINEHFDNAKLFDAFPNQCVYIHSIKEEIIVLTSLQRPRKVILTGSDGKNYGIMLKPKDDLRKDFRLMEFNAVVKQYLYQDPDAKQRRLGIRTYAVLPLNEECGLIEWVENLIAFRQILMKFYKQRNLSVPIQVLKEAASNSRLSIDKKRDFFLKTLLPKHPPLFGEWLKQRFTTPHNWYQARNSFIQTTAVMSIVGYILGLGDRHGENILFDSTNGDTVHVDFNCLFNKGETMECPEKVPFRLTQNMVHAMGPLGIEGTYRKCCEITLRVLQSQKSILMSILKPFVYDPLVSWNKMSKNDGNTERTDPQAMANIQHIEERLKGYVKIYGHKTNMPLSVEGQVNTLILEATDIDNLASMYIGWGPYL